MSMKVIGAGPGRTGTASLKVALEALGVGRCYHMSEVLQNPVCTGDWIGAANGKPNWEKIFAGYGATVDYPGCNFWNELADYYPDAKVLLTVRDAESWFESVNETIMSASFRQFTSNSPWGDMLRKIIYDRFDSRIEDRDFMVSYYENRNAEIIATIAADRLLVYQVRDGWKPLCEFLGVPVPDMEFPRINSRDETKQLLAQMSAAGGGALTEEAMSEAATSLHGKTAK
jgi:hypothetical protein